MPRVDLSHLHKVAYLDPASGKAQTKRMSARAAITVVGQDSQDHIFVLYAWCGRIPTNALVEKLFEINRLFRPRVFGGEADALQSLFQDAIKMIADDRGEPLPLHPHTHSTKLDKDFRIRTILQPVIADGRLVLSETQAELLAELEGFPSYPTKDLVDSLASAISLLPERPLRLQRQKEAEALADYLRRTGAPASYIEQRVGVPTLRPHPLATMVQRAGLRRPLPRFLQE